MEATRNTANLPSIAPGLRALLDHIAEELAAEYVLLMEQASAAERACQNDIGNHDGGES